MEEDEDIVIVEVFVDQALPTKLFLLKEQISSNMRIIQQIEILPTQVGREEDQWSYETGDLTCDLLFSTVNQVVNGLFLGDDVIFTTPNEKADINVFEDIFAT